MNRTTTGRTSQPVWPLAVGIVLALAGLGMATVSWPVEPPFHGPWSGEFSDARWLPPWGLTTFTWLWLGVAVIGVLALGRGLLAHLRSGDSARWFVRSCLAGAASALATGVVIGLMVVERRSAAVGGGYLGWPDGGPFPSDTSNLLAQWSIDARDQMLAVGLTGIGCLLLLATLVALGRRGRPAPRKVWLTGMGLTLLGVVLIVLNRRPEVRHEVVWDEVNFLNDSLDSQPVIEWPTPSDVGSLETVPDLGIALWVGVATTTVGATLLVVALVSVGTSRLRPVRTRPDA